LCFIRVCNPARTHQRSAKNRVDADIRVDINEVVAFLRKSVL
jgi:hypothetical protein